MVEAAFFRVIPRAGSSTTGENCFTTMLLTNTTRHTGLEPTTFCTQLLLGSLKKCETC